jgi:hypothetical protein
MKKVRYLVGAVGIAPAALGLMTQAPATAGTVHPVKQAKAVSLRHSAVIPDAGCVASAEHQKIVTSSPGYVRLGFYYTSHAATTCIGTIFVHAGGRFNWVDAQVSARDGETYCKMSGQPPIEWGCHGSFYRPFKIWVFASTNGGAGGGDTMKFSYYI